MPRATVRGTAATAAVILAALTPQSSPRADDITEAEAHAIAIDAYLYFYPLVTMDVTRRQLTNASAENSEIGGAPNAFKNVQAFPTADMRAGAQADSGRRDARLDPNRGGLGRVIDDDLPPRAVRPHEIVSSSWVRRSRGTLPLRRTVACSYATVS